jgi:hypothetical protein
VTADCNCDATGGCTIIVTDGVLYCGTGTCKGSCGLVVEIPTKFFERF